MYDLLLRKYKGILRFAQNDRLSGEWRHKMPPYMASKTIKGRFKTRPSILAYDIAEIPLKRRKPRRIPIIFLQEVVLLQQRFVVSHFPFGKLGEEVFNDFVIGGSGL